MHIAMDAAMANPRCSHCYQDEDFIGLTKRTYVGCHQATAALRSVQRYALGSAIELQAREQLLQGQRAPRAARPGRGGPLRAGPALQAAAAAGSRPEAAGTKRGRGRPPVLTAKRPRGRPKTRR